MKEKAIKHEHLLQNAAYGAAERLIDIVMAKAEFKEIATDENKLAMIAEIYKLNMFLIFARLQDSKHANDPYFERLTENLHKEYELNKAEALEKALEDLKAVPEAEQILQEKILFVDPFTAYFNAIKSGSKDFRHLPFGILSAALAESFFPENLQEEANNAFSQLMPQSSLQVLEFIDKVPDKIEIIE